LGAARAAVATDHAAPALPSTGCRRSAAQACAGTGFQYSARRKARRAGSRGREWAAPAADAGIFAAVAAADRAACAAAAEGTGADAGVVDGARARAADSGGSHRGNPRGQAFAEAWQARRSCQEVAEAAYSRRMDSGRSHSAWEADVGSSCLRTVLLASREAGTT
jgi:hypothetical protein